MLLCENFPEDLSMQTSGYKCQDYHIYLCLILNYPSY